MNGRIGYVGFAARVAVFIGALALGAALAVLSARAAFAASLRTEGTIVENVLRLGDIFDGLDADKAAFVLGPAPLPGQDMVLNARTLMRIALATGLPWRPAGVTDQIVLRRTAFTIQEKEITAALSDNLKEAGVDGRFEIRFNGMPPTLTLPQENPAGVEISGLDYDAQRGTFRATVSAPSQTGPAVQAFVSGQVMRFVRVPVLRAALKNGDIIGARDIDWTEMPSRDVRDGAIMDAAALEGMTPRRGAPAGKPLMPSDVETPQLVARGDSVIIVYESGPIALTAQGRALQAGAKGDTVRVMNEKSHQSLDAFVTAEREVTVR